MVKMSPSFLRHIGERLLVPRQPSALKKDRALLPRHCSRGLSSTLTPTINQFKTEGGGYLKLKPVHCDKQKHKTQTFRRTFWAHVQVVSEILEELSDHTRVRLTSHPLQQEYVLTEADSPRAPELAVMEAGRQTQTRSLSKCDVTNSAT